jgi:hypothetical protein
MKKIVLQAAEMILYLVRNDFCAVRNDFCAVQNDFSPVQNDFSPVRNDFSPVRNDFCAVRNDFSPVPLLPNVETIAQTPVAILYVPAIPQIISHPLAIEFH